MNSRGNSVNTKLAQDEWEILLSAYRGLGCGVVLLEPQERYPDMVFVADSGVVVGTRVLLSRFRFYERRGETKHYRDWFLKNQFDVSEIRSPIPAYLEGCGDVVTAGDTMFSGYGFRSNRIGHRKLRKLFGAPVVSLKLVDPYFYHLNTCFLPLTRGELVYYPEAFDQKGKRYIWNRFNEKVVAVTKEDAMRFFCNATVIDDFIVTGARPTDRLAKMLGERGYEIVSLPLGEFQKAGGGAACLTLAL